MRDLKRSRIQEVIVAVTDNMADNEILLLGSGLALSVEVQHTSALLGLKIVRLRIPAGRRLADVIAQVTRRAVADQWIIYAQLNFVFETVQTTVAKATTRDVGGVPQYSTTTVRLVQAHQVALGRGVRVAVIDTGLGEGHSQLAGAVIDSFDAVDEGPASIGAHGTAIVGIAAARQQMIGMALFAQLLAVCAFSTGAIRKSEARTLSIIRGLIGLQTRGPASST
jgi:hypothetical protein